MPNLRNSESDTDLNLQQVRQEQLLWLMQFFEKKMRKASPAGKGVDWDEESEKWLGQSRLARWILKLARNHGDPSALRSLVQQGLRLKKDDAANYQGGELTDGNLTTIALAYQALVGGAWTGIHNHELPDAIDECLSGLRDWETARQHQPKEADKPNLRDLYMLFKRLVPDLESALQSARSAESAIRATISEFGENLGQNTEKEGANPPEIISNSKIPIMSKNMAQFAAAMQRAIDASGRPPETVRRGCVGRSRVRGEKFDRALAGDESMELSPGDVMDLHVCVGADAWEYSLEELRELAGCGDCGDRVSR